MLIWLPNCVIPNSTDTGTFAIIDTKLYFPVVTLPSQEGTKLQQQFKSGFKWAINWSEYRTEINRMYNEIGI